MVYFRQNPATSLPHFDDGQVPLGWPWGSTPGCWSVGQSLTILASTSLAIWTTILLAVLN
jgi:hypothetical protein